MDELKKELYKIVYEYSIEEKIADKVFIERVLDLCINAFNVNEYILDRKIEEYNGNKYIQTGYNINEKTVYFNLESIKNDGLNQVLKSKEKGIKSNTFLDYFKINSNFLNAIIHEIMHAYQYKKCLRNDNDLETEILKISLERNLEAIKKEKITMQKNWYYMQLDKQYNTVEPYREACPSERMADIKAFEFERDISKLVVPSKKLNIVEYNELKLLNIKMNGYQECAPTTFVTLINEILKDNVGLPYKTIDMFEIEEMYRKLSQEHNLSLDERIWLGLPITEEEKEKELQKGKELRYILLKRD